VPGSEHKGTCRNRLRVKVTRISIPAIIPLSISITSRMASISITRAASTSPGITTRVPGAAADPAAAAVISRRS